MDTEALIRRQIADNPIILYMKGTPEAPECGFSAAAVALLKKHNREFAFVNVLKAPHIREKLPRISQWPTYPQLFVKSELVGGCDIIQGMEGEGTLGPLLEGAG